MPFLISSGKVLKYDRGTDSNTRRISHRRVFFGNKILLELLFSEMMENSRRVHVYVLRPFYTDTSIDYSTDKVDPEATPPPPTFPRQHWSWMGEQPGDPGQLTSSVVRHSKNTIMGARSGWSKLSIHRVVWKRNDDSTEPTPTILPWKEFLDRKALDFLTDGMLQQSFQSEWWTSCRSEVVLMGQCPN